MKAIISILIVLFSTSLFGATSTDKDYKKIFGKDYDNAFDFLKKNTWINDSLLKEDIDPAFAIAIVFPEIIRYSAILDIIESSALKTLYIQNGEKFADFSIGYFQMKPSFAETIENIHNKILQKAGNKTKIFDTQKTSSARKARILRLDNAKWQLRYLILFIKIMDAKYPNNSFANDTEKIRFYATAYNFGFTSDFSTIKKHINACTFYTGLFTNTDTKYYCYSDISASYYIAVKH